MGLPTPPTAASSDGRIVQVIGPVVDVAFDNAELPEIYTALTLTNPAMPFVRYETGDRLHWHSRERAPSGVSWALVSAVPRLRVPRR